MVCRTKGSARQGGSTIASIANLVVSLIAETGKFETDMKRAGKSQAAAMKQMEAEARRAGTAIAAAFVATAAAVTAVVIKSAQAADAIDEMSDRTGVSTEALSQYQFIVEDAGVSLESFAASINKMQRAVSDANQGVGSSVEKFTQLGLSVSDLMRLSPDQQFEEIAGAIAGLGSATERAAASQEIFGRSGAKLLPVILQGKEGIKAAREEFDSFGITISQEFADNASKFTSNMKSMEAVSVGLGRSFTEGILPSLLDIQRGLLDMAGGTDTARTAGEKFGSILKTMANALIIVKEAALLFGRVLLGSVLVVFNAIRAAVSPITASIFALGQALQSLAAGDFTGALDAIKNVPTTIAREFETASEKMRTAAGFLKAEFTDEIPAALARLNTFFNAHETVVNESAGAHADLGKELKKTADLTKVSSTVTKDQLKWVERLNKEIEEQKQTQEEYNASLQDFKDIADPVGALVREFAAAVAAANIMLAKGDITLQQYQDGLNVLSDQLGETVAGMQDVVVESDAMTEAMLEGVRILERTFNDLWTGLLDGSLDVWDGILDGFKAMLAQMLHTMISAPLIEALQEAFKPGGGGLGSLDFSTIGTAIAGGIGVGLGSLLGGGGQFASIGSGIGSLLGQAAGTSLLGSLGAFAGPIGIVIGGLLGGLLGGLFDKKKTPKLTAGGSALGLGKGEALTVESALGTTFLNFRHGEMDALRAIGKSLTEFDNSIAAIVSDDQLGIISDALKSWKLQLTDDAIDIETLLNSRFNTILGTFSGAIQDFVNGAIDLEDKFARLQVGVGAEQLFAEQPDIFGQHTVVEFLAVVEAFRNGSETIVDAFKEVVTMLEVIVSVQQSLTDFASSNLGDDFATMLRLQSESVVETLTRTTTSLADAISNFDGSPEQLVAIGNLAMSVRQQELQALALIDSVAKGLNANLDRLLADTKATISGPRAAEDVLFDARALITAVSQADTPEEIAAIGQQFEALIRSLSPEDTKAFATSTLAIIESFQAASNVALDQAKQAILDSGQAIRDMTAGFATLIDPLTIIANTNQKAADILQSIADGTSVVSVLPVQDVAIADPVGQAQILSDGINEALSSGVDNMAARLANAIRTGFAGTNVVVNVTVQDQGLVTR